MNKQEKRYLMENYASTKVFAMLGPEKNTLHFNKGMNWAYACVAQNSGINTHSLDLEVEKWARKNCPAVINSTACIVGCRKCDHIQISDSVKAEWGV